MCHNTICRQCYEVLNLKCAMPTETIGIHYLEHPRCYNEGGKDKRAMAFVN